jgi:hypothetical protein
VIQLQGDKVMGTDSIRSRLGSAVLLAGALALLAGCGSKETPAPAAPPAAPPAAAPPAAATADTGAAPAEAAAPTSQALAPTEQTWTPEDLEALLAPIALFPDPVLAQVMLASTNPQEVLDAGNWLIANPDLQTKALDQAAEKAGFTPPVRAIMQFRQIVDQMCLEMDWTTELGQAFTNDQAGVLTAVQRLRSQAMEVGNLQSSEQMKVETKVQDGQEAIIIEPPSPQVVYVPTYDPVTAYAPPPAAAAPAATTTTTTSSDDDDEGHSTGALVTTGLLAFGAGILVNEVFDDDDDDYYHHHDYYPNYYGGGGYYPPPYPYRPAYGNGYRPSNNYNRPQTYNKVLSDNNVVVVNPDRNKDYWNSYDKRGTTRGATTKARSPITAAKPGRSDLSQLNANARSRPAAGQAQSRDQRGQSGYAGARPEVRAQAKLPPATKNTASKAAANASSAKSRVAGGSSDRGYAGARPSGGSRTESARPSTAARPEAAQRDRPAAQSAASARPSQQQSRPRPQAAPSGGGRDTAMGGSSRGASERAASQRGRQSMPQGAKHQRGGGGGGKRDR